MIIQIVVVGICVIVIAFFGWLIWQNWGSQENYEIIKPIVGGLLVAGFFVASLLLVPPQSLKQKTHIVILTKNEDIVSFPRIHELIEPYDGYFLMDSIVILLRQNGIIIHHKENHQYITELIEWATCSWIAKNYPQHWQTDRDWISGISGGAGCLRPKKSHYKKLTNIRISALLKNNMYTEVIKTKISILDEFIHLPNGTNVSYQKHTIIWDNRNVTLKIAFMPSYIGKVESVNKLGRKLSETLGSDIYEHDFIVEFSATPKPFNRWSVLTKIQTDWLKEMFQLYDKSFSFSMIRKEIEN